MSQRQLLPLLGAILALTPALASGAAVPSADVSIELTGVPPRLSFPLSEGSNVLITATLRGGEPGAVWLGITAGSALRVPLTRISDQQYRINLAHPDAQLLADANRERRELRIFASVGDTVVESVPIIYTRRPRAVHPVCFVTEHSADGGVVHELVRQQQRWIDLDRLDRLHVRFDRGDTPLAVRARIGELTIPLVPHENGHRFDARLDARLRTAWLSHGSLELEHQGDIGWHPITRLPSVPRKLDLDGSGVSLRIYQRTSEPVPGSREYLRIRIGDITRGQTQLVLSDGRDEIRVRRSVRPGVVLSFELAAERYSLLVRRLVNLPFGEDWAELEISRLEPGPLRDIHRLIDRVEKSELTFIRNGDRYTPQEAARHLRRKLAHSAESVASVSSFIAELASKSSITGEPYQVELADGRTLDAGVWLRAEWQRLSMPEKRKRF